MKDIINSNVLKIGIAVLSLYAINTIYNNYNENEKQRTSDENNLIVNDYLLSEIKSNKLKKPILWIHIPYKLNSRNWESFYSRSNENINQPYILLCIKSIIDTCGNSFHVCIIDDDTFPKLLPNWNINMSKISEPLLGYIRSVAFMKLLYNYGGMFVPYSFVCYKNLIDLYNTSTLDNKPFFCEFKNYSAVSNIKEVYPSYIFMGCLKENEIINNIIRLFELHIHNNSTNEINFTGSLDKILYEKIINNQAILIDGKYIGTKTSENNTVTLEMLFSEKEITFTKNIKGIYLPHDKILENTKYNWFSQLHVDNTVEGDLNIFYILKKSVNQYL